MQFGKYLAEVFHCADATGNAAIRHEGDGLGLPLLVDRVDDQLEGRRIAVVVLGCDDEKAIGIGNQRAQLVEGWIVRGAGYEGLVEGSGIEDRDFDGGIRLDFGLA